MPVLTKLFLCYVATEPVDLCIRRFQAFVCYAIAGHSLCCRVVGMYWDWGLLVSLYLEFVARGDGFPAVDE